MRIAIHAVGKLKQGPDRDLYAHYCARLEAAGQPVALAPLRSTEIAEARGASAAARKVDEAERLLRLTAEADVRVALDETGKSLSSAAFAQWIRARRDGGAREMAFLVGGPDGHGEAARTAAQLVLSLGPMTLPHGLARIVLAEQLYRAATIIAGHPYHRA